MKKNDPRNDWFSAEFCPTFEDFRFSERDSLVTAPKKLIN